MTADWKKSIIQDNAKMIDALRVIDQAEMQVALVVDENNKLLGVITDGDIRRAILKAQDFNTPVIDIMNKTPTTGTPDMTRQQMLGLMRMKTIHQLPILDNIGRLIGMEMLDQLWQQTKHENQVILMAGGLGTRLKERTKDCPKPLLKIGNKPILETILDSFIEYGFYRFTISLGYRGDMIADYLGDGKKWGVEISYVQENEPLGTAGALSLLPEKPKDPFFVMNGDILTKVNYRQLLRFHNEHQASATMCVNGFDHRIPYGVVNMNDVNIQSIEEKPVQSIMVNAGIYVLSPDCLDHVPQNEHYNMTSLFEDLIKAEKSTVGFPIREYWLDVGQPKDFDRAEQEFDQNFNKEAS